MEIKVGHIVLYDTKRRGETKMAIIKRVRPRAPFRSCLFDAVIRGDRTKPFDVVLYPAEIRQNLTQKFKTIWKRILVQRVLREWIDSRLHAYYVPNGVLVPKDFTVKWPEK